MEYSILDVAKILIKKIKGQDIVVEDWIEYIEDRPFNDKDTIFQTKKLDWEIKIGFEQGIDKLI